MTDLRTAAQALVDRWDTPNWKDAPHTGKYIDALRAALSAPAGWIVTKNQKPRGGQLIVKRWKNGAVWAGTHDEGPKNESFDWWLPLPAAPSPQEQT